MSTAAKSTAAGAELKLRVEDMAGLHSGLARAMGEAGIGGPRQHDLFAGPIHATCVGCGLVVTGEDLGHIAVTSTAEATTDNKLDRLRLGYCGRAGCESRYYLLVVDPAQGIEPARVLQRAVELWRNPPPPEPEIPAGPVPWWKVRRNQIALGALVAVILIWRWFGPARGPLSLRNEVEYKAGPSQVVPATPAPESRPSTSPARTQEALE
jgi:hypothetical protein